MIGDLGFAIKYLNNNNNKKETKKATVAKLRYAWDPEVSNRSPRCHHPLYSCVHLEISVIFFQCTHQLKSGILTYSSTHIYANQQLYTVTCSLVCKSLELT